MLTQKLGFTLTFLATALVSTGLAADTYKHLNVGTAEVSIDTVDGVTSTYLTYETDKDSGITLIVRCKPKGFDIYLNDWTGLNANTIDPDLQQGVPVKWQFKGGAANKFGTWSFFGDKGSVGINSPSERSRFFHQALKSNELTITLKPGNIFGGTDLNTRTFDITGFAKAARYLKCAK